MTQEQLEMVERTAAEKRDAMIRRMAEIGRRVAKSRAREEQALEEAKALVHEAHYERGLGQQQIASLVDVHRQTVRRWLGLDLHLNKVEAERAKRRG